MCFEFSKLRPTTVRELDYDFVSDFAASSAFPFAQCLSWTFRMCLVFAGPEKTNLLVCVWQIQIHWLDMFDIKKI